MNKKSTENLMLTLRFYGDLNNFLYQNRRGKFVKRLLPEPTSVKDLIEGCGVPHTEVDLILVDDAPVDFNTKIKGGERVSVYPFINSLEMDKSFRLQKPKLPHPGFIADVNLGKLARYLRMAGFDTAYRNDYGDEKLIDIMLEENRTLLTRDRKLLMRNAVTFGYLPRSDNPAFQLEEVVKRFDLYDELEPYTRCVNCNRMLESVEKATIINQLEPLTKKYFHEFSQCPGCGKIYWKGSHRDRLHPKVRKILDRH